MNTQRLSPHNDSNSSVFNISTSIPVQSHQKHKKNTLTQALFNGDTCMIVVCVVQFPCETCNDVMHMICNELSHTSNISFSFVHDITMKCLMQNTQIIAASVMIADIRTCSYIGSKIIRSRT